MMAAATELYDRIINKELTVRRINITAGRVIAEKEAAIAELAKAPAPMKQPAAVNTSQTVQEKPFLASDCKNRKDAKQAHENLKQMLQDRM
jgi:hypothetical protein